MAEDILVVAEHRAGKVVSTTFELVALARSLAGQTGGTVGIALLGHGAALGPKLAEYADVLVVDDANLAHYSPGGYEQGIRGILQATAPRGILLAHSSQGFDLAPALAVALEAPLVTNCVALRFDGSSLVATRKLLNEKVVAEVELTSDRPFVATVRPAAVKAAEPLPSPGSITPISATIDPAKLGTSFVRMETPQVQDIDIASADIVVSAGRGIKEKKNLALVEEFAKLLGGVVGASRPLTDMEWLPKTRQVGQSGKTVRPKLYIACGISGAMQHVSGMKDAGTIVAINTDPSAPIFEVAHYGFTANVLELLPAVVKELRGG